MVVGSTIDDVITVQPPSTSQTFTEVSIGIIYQSINAIAKLRGGLIMGASLMSLCVLCGVVMFLCPVIFCTQHPKSSSFIVLHGQLLDTSRPLLSYGAIGNSQ